MGLPPEDLGGRSYPPSPAAGQDAIDRAGSALSARLRETGIGHVLRGVTGKGRVVAEPSALAALARSLPPIEGLLVDLLCGGRVVPVEGARRALGSAFEALEAIGVLVEGDEGVCLPDLCLFASPFGWLFGDRPFGQPGAPVRPARAFVDDESVELAERVARAVPVARALDLGCGAGLTTLAAARSAGAVVGVDVSPEAVGAARLGVALAGLGDRVEVRPGDLFEAVRPEERFDRLVAVLPALPLPDGVSAPAHAGGAGGSSLSARVIRDAPRWLRDGGEVWIGGSVLLAGDHILTTPLLSALSDSGAEVAWSRGAPVRVHEAAEALGRMLGADVPAASMGWRSAVLESFHQAGATAFAPAIFRVCWRPRAETVAGRTDLVQWRR